MDTKIIEKIQACLNRGDANQNDNPHEREIAMRHAQSLLAKHGLTLAEVTDQTEIKASLGALGRTEQALTTKFVWESGVWGEIAELNGCKIIRSAGRNKRVWIIGRQLRCEVVKQIALYAVDSIKREAKNQGF